MIEGVTGRGQVSTKFGEEDLKPEEFLTIIHQVCPQPSQPPRLLLPAGQPLSGSPRSIFICLRRSPRTPA